MIALLEKLRFLHSDVVILLLITAIASCSSQLIFSFLFLEKGKKIIAIPFSGAQECCLISFWVYVYFEKWGSVQNAMGEMTIHFSFILRAFFSIQQISLFLSRTLYYLKSPVHHCASQVDSPISDTTSGYFLSSTSLSSLLQKLSGSYLLVLNS